MYLNPNSLPDIHRERELARKAFVLGVCAGLALLVLGDKASAVADLVNQLNGLVDFLMGAVGKLIPAFVFLSIFSTITTESFGEMGGAVKCILLHHPLCTDGTSRGASAPGHRGEPAAGIPHDGGKFNLPAVGAGAGIRPAGNAGRGAAAERQSAENRAPVKGPCSG